MFDGAGAWYILARVFVPLSKPVLATIALFTIVTQWNDFFQGLVLSTGEKYYPLQTYIKQLIFQVDTSTMNAEQIKQASMMSSGTAQAPSSASASTAALRACCSGVSLGRP